MSGYGSFVALLGLLAVALAALGSIAALYTDEARRIRRSLRQVLEADPHALLVAQGRGRGVGFNFTSNVLAVTWDAGAWCLIYRIEELVGAELIIDGRVAGRVYRGEPRRPLDSLTGADQLVRLRLIFNDAGHPDFDLDLWTPENDKRRRALSAPEAIQEGNRWLARTESLFRRRPAPARVAGGAAGITAAGPAQVASGDQARRDVPEPRRELAFDIEDDPDQNHEELTP